MPATVKATGLYKLLFVSQTLFIAHKPRLGQSKTILNSQ
uniref:Uncharacterized protein n=1 Tax=Anguilla anguilla TaxID=7936 RepID=A0A0E9USG9_ANGAN